MALAARCEDPQIPNYYDPRQGRSAANRHDLALEPMVNMGIGEPKYWTIDGLL
jgi:methionine aminopeptidase